MNALNNFTCQVMTARDSGPHNNESGKGRRAPIYTTATAERKVEDSVSCLDLKRELDSARKVERNSIPSVRPAAQSECVSFAPQHEARLSQSVERITADSKPAASRGTLITEATFTLCDSCGCYFDEDGNEQIEKPHRHDVNSEAGICPSCVATLTRLKVPIFQDLPATEPTAGVLGNASEASSGTHRPGPVGRFAGETWLRTSGSNFTTVLKAA
jgi:hypothetical protein